MRKIKSKKENCDVELSVACKHLLSGLKPVKIHEISFGCGESTFMCPKCYRTDKMFKDIEDKNIDDWITVCNNCIHKQFKKIELELIEN